MTARPDPCPHWSDSEKFSCLPCGLVVAAGATVLALFVFFAVPALVLTWRFWFA